MTITFSEDMNTNYSLPFLNESFINIAIVPIELGDEYEAEVRNLNLTWEVKNFSGKVLNISMKFVDPI
jgi:hypothetical protein